MVAVSRKVLKMLICVSLVYASIASWLGRVSVDGICPSCEEHLFASGYPKAPFGCLGANTFGPRPIALCEDFGAGLAPPGLADYALRGLQKGAVSWS